MLGEGARERFVRANGLSHHVIEWGPPAAAETVVLCHGFLDLGWGFAALAPRLASARRVVAFDFRGHGETDWIGAGGYYHFADYVLDLHELVPQVSTGKLHLVGHSMGGTVSTLFAATHPERIATLSLLEGLGPPADDARDAAERMKRWLAGVDEVRAAGGPSALPDLEHAAARLGARHPGVAAELLRFLAARSTRPHPGGQGLAWRFDPLHRTRSPLGFDRDRFLEFTRLVSAPTLLVEGERGMRPADRDVRAHSLARARTVVVAGAGHMMHWTHSGEVAGLLEAHFAACAA
jgi:pimeloyl-ACP methyl ester carboxylesterase